MLAVIEIQNDNIAPTSETTLFIDTAQAKSYYHQVLSEAAVSDVPEHSVILVSEEGSFMFHEKYIHETEEVEE